MSLGSGQTDTESTDHPTEITVSRPGRVAFLVSSPSGSETIPVEDETIVIGTGAASAVRVDDPKVSKHHCKIEIKEDGVILQDCGSKNGTWIGDVRIERIWLPAGAMFTVGRTTIRLQRIDPINVPVSTGTCFGRLHGRGTKMGELFAKLKRIAERSLDVLCLGENGTGKELIARGIHDHSDRRNGPFVVVDCTELNGGIAESILFGHRKGSFTDAKRDQPGLLERADGGTLFIDEIGELPLELQPKLLRCLERRETRRLGDHDYTEFDARVIVATNKDLLQMISEGAFREDLYYRLASIKVVVPPLRERDEGNIELLADRFLDIFAQERQTSLRFDRDVYGILKRHPWPGNVRELYHAIRQVAMMAQGEVVLASDLPSLDVPKEQQSRSVEVPIFEEMEELFHMSWNDARSAFRRLYATHLMTQSNGNLTQAARAAGVQRNTFKRLLQPEDE